jgi:hypothetical protein
MEAADFSPWCSGVSGVCPDSSAASTFLAANSFSKFVWMLTKFLTLQLHQLF